jgi:4-hydroxybenzoate polyprenyltransferase
MISYKSISRYFSLVKFSHTIFAMPFAIIGYFLAIYYSGGSFSWKLFLLVVLCMVFARNAAMAFNRYIDRHFDSLNPRTASREVPAGVVRPKSALAFTLINCLLFICITWFINKLTFYLSPVALFVVLGYSVTKRFTALCHFILGLGLSLAPVGAFLSVAGYFHWLPIMFSLIVLSWVSGFDIIYALQDKDFDKSLSLKSMPVFLGLTRAIILSIVLHLVTAAIVITTGLIADFGVMYWIGAILFIGLLIYQHLLVRPNDLSRVNLAFATLNGIGSIIFASFTVAELVFK